MSTAIKNSTPIKSSLIFRIASVIKKFRLQAEQSIQGVPFNTGSLSALSACKRAVLSGTFCVTLFIILLFAWHSCHFLHEFRCP